MHNRFIPWENKLEDNTKVSEAVEGKTDKKKEDSE
jgi:hypothetical protein